MRTLVALALGLFVLPLVPPAIAAACVPSCEVLAHELGFFPRATVAEAGAWIEWRGLDALHHTSTDADFRNTLCFDSHYGGAKVGRVMFEVRGSELWAYSDADPVARLCDGSSVRALADGDFAVSYVCTDHTRFMQGTIVVEG